MSKLEHALDAAARGFAVFPQQGKRPAIRRWPDNASSKPSVITRWWTRWPEHDIGIALPPDIYVLDADTPAAMDALYAMEADGTLPPATLTVRTAKGEHRYFRVPHELARKTPGPNATGLAAIEGKGSPGPVTWAGSVHPSGHVYRIAFDAPIAHMPGELVRAIGPKRARRDHGDATAAERELWACAHAHATVLIGFDWIADARADLRLTARALRCELPDMPSGWADRAFRAGAYLGPHVATGALGLDQTIKELTDIFAELDTEGRDNSHVLRSIERGLATGARGAVAL